MVSVLLALVAPVLRSVSTRTSSPSRPSYSLDAGSTMVLPSTGATTDLLAVVFDQQARRYVVARYSYTAQHTGGGDLVWVSDPIPSSGRDVSYAVDGDDLYLVTGPSVWKLDSATGERQWESELSDRVAPDCPDCFSVIDGHLVAQTIDGQVVALASGSGKEVWRRRFEDPGGSVAVAHGQLLVVDRSPEIDAATVYRLDPTTGEERNGRALRCTRDDSHLDALGSASTPVFAIPDSNDVVAFFGFGVGCALRWNVDSADVRWEGTWEFGPQSFGPPPVLSAHHLAISTSPSDVVVIDLDDGHIRALEAIVDTDITPWAIAGTTVLAASESQRGTTRAGLVGWDAETGERSWVEGSGQPSALVDRTVRSGANLTAGERLWIAMDAEAQADGEPTVVEIDHASRQATVRTIDPATGETVRSRAVAYRHRRDASRSGWLSFEDQRDGVLVVELEGLLQVIDVRAGLLLGWRNGPGN